MENDGPIYIVKPKHYQSLDELYGIFDCEKKARQFINRFKTRPGNLEIIERSINPSYYSDQTIDPYYITLDKIAILPKEVFICHSIPMVQGAEVESYDIVFDHQNGEQDGTFIFQCFAANEKKAIGKAIIKRDTLIHNGDWERTWVNYNLKRYETKATASL